MICDTSAIMMCMCSIKGYDWIGIQNMQNNQYCNHRSYFNDRCYYLPSLNTNIHTSVFLNGSVTRYNTQDGTVQAPNILVCDSNGHIALIDHERIKEYMLTECPDMPSTMVDTCRIRPEDASSSLNPIRKNCANTYFYMDHGAKPVLYSKKRDAQWVIQPVGYCAPSCQKQYESKPSFLVVSSTGRYKCMTETLLSSEIFDIIYDTELGNVIITYVTSLGRRAGLKQNGASYEDFGTNEYGELRQVLNIKEILSFKLCKRFLIESTFNAIYSPNDIIMLTPNVSRYDNYASNGRLVRELDACNPVDDADYNPLTLQRLYNIPVPTTASTKSPPLTSPSTSIRTTTKRTLVIGGGDDDDDDDNSWLVTTQAATSSTNDAWDLWPWNPANPAISASMTHSYESSSIIISLYLLYIISSILQ